MSNALGSSNYRTVTSGSEGQGAITPPASSDAELILTFNTSSHRLLAMDTVSAEIAYADKDSEHQALCVIGITLNAALAGDPVRYTSNGKVTGLAGLTPGRVWLGLEGQLTQVVPTTGLILCVGTVLEDSTTLMLNIGHSVRRS